MNGTGPKRDYFGLVGVVLALIVYLVTFAFGYGQQSARLDSIDKRLERVERTLETSGTRAAN